MLVRNAPVRVYRRWPFLLGAALTMGTMDPVRALEATAELEQITIIATTPMPGTGVDIDKVPSHVQTLSTHELNRDGGAASLPGEAARHLPSVNVNDEQGSQYQPDFVYRGFEASPISGIAQGLAVYENGVRLNEAFGDTVNWDLVPQFAIERLTVQSDNPVFGLNALGGAVTLEMKDGFGTADSALRLSAGSFGNLTGYAEYGGRTGNFGFYGALGGMQDGGFRYHSPTSLHQAYADIGYERGPAKVHLAISAANNTIGAVGPTPVQMLQQDPRAVFTYPQSMHNSVNMFELSVVWQMPARQSLSANLYHRQFTQQLIDGNTTDVMACTNNASYFCLEGTDQYPGDLLFDTHGNPVPVSALPAGATPGSTVHTRTATAGSGGTLQWSTQIPLFRRANTLVTGVALAHGDTRYNAAGELGTLLPSLEVNGSGLIIDQSRSTTAQPPLLEPALLQATNTYAGVYFTDTYELSTATAWTLSGRFNRASIGLQDLLGNTLNGKHVYQRFNPGIGMTVKLHHAVTAYASYSQANRAPTPAELSCSNPLSPCPLDSFLVSDPDLKQVVSHTLEAGLRGRFDTENGAGHFTWNASWYRTDNLNDITLLATRVNGFGYFSNAGSTRRQGAEGSLTFHSPRWEWTASYGRVDATYRDSLILSSNSPAADAQGDIHVRAGNVIPLTPRQRVTVQAERALGARWRLSGAARFVSAQYLVGDSSNQEPPLPAYAVMDLDLSCQVRKTVRLFAAIDNLFSKAYYTYGAFTTLQGLPPNFQLTDPRTLGPSPGQTLYAGVQMEL